MPSTTRRRWNAAAWLLALGIGAAAGYQAFAANRIAGQPTVIVTINLAQVMEKLDQRAEMTARINQMQEKMRAEQDRRTTEHRRMQEEGMQLEKELEAATDPEQRRALERRVEKLQADLALALLEFQGWVSFSADKLDIESALALQDLYRSVKSAAAQMASANRYDIVVVDDSQGELATTPDSRLSRMDQVRQQIAGRRLLHVNAGIDITDDLIQRMNNARRAPGPRQP